jgi:hypothetical protein
MSDMISGDKSHKRPKRWIILEIPLLLFSLGILLITMGGYGYLSSANYLSKFFIHDEYKPATQAQKTEVVKDGQAQTEKKTIEYTSIKELLKEGGSKN